MVIPALGPSFGVAPSGTWICTLYFSKISCFIPSFSALDFMYSKAMVADSFITLPKFPVMFRVPFPLLMVDSINESVKLNIDYIIYLSIFILGSVVGLFGFSHIISWLFKHFKDYVLSLLTGFILGSLLIIWPWKKVYINSDETINSFNNLEITNNYLKYLPDLSESNDLIALIWILFGFLFVIYIENYASRKKNIWTNRKKN